MRPQVHFITYAHGGHTHLAVDLCNRALETGWFSQATRYDENDVLPLMSGKALAILCIVWQRFAQVFASESQARGNVATGHTA